MIARSLALYAARSLRSSGVTCLQLMQSNVNTSTTVTRPAVGGGPAAFAHGVAPSTGDSVVAAARTIAAITTCPPKERRRYGRRRAGGLLRRAWRSPR